MTLAAGGCLCVPSDQDRRNNLPGSIASLRANLLQLTPSVAQFLSPEEMPELQSIIFAGEALRVTDVKPWWGKVQVINTYGPSECTPISTINCNASSPEEATRIGKGAGQVTWVVDPENHDHLLPLGCIGELLLEGPLVGRGYLNDPEKTAAAFIQDPAWLLQGAPGRPGRHGRLYKTGDLVRYNEDGSLTFMGRKDAQVKIRGQRVELGEVEHRVQECMPEARQVVAEVIVPQGENSSPALAAFLQMNDTRESDEAEGTTVNILPITADIEEKLAEHLPIYMVPTVFFSMRELPMTATGKTDRKRLREIGGSFSVQKLAEMRTEGRGIKRQPTTEVERQIQRIWAQVLNIDPATIGLDDSFFQLGGDSITAMQVSSAARSLSIHIRAGDILRKKTISSLARDLGVTRPVRGSSTPLDEAHTSDSAIQLSPIQRLYLYLQPDATKPFDQCFLLKLNTKIGYNSLSGALETLVRRHSILRTRFSKTNEGTWEQRISSNVLESICVRVQESADSEVAAQIIAQCREGLDIESGRLIGAVLFDNTERQTLFLTIHHLVVDLVSWRVLFQELEELLTLGTIATSPSMRFQTWSALQAQYAIENLDPKTSTHFKIQPPFVSYWGMEHSPNLQNGTIVNSFALNELTSSLLLGSCDNAFGTRPVELMISALIYSFGLVFSDRPAPPIFSEGHGREPWDDEIDISTTVGWFTTMFPVQISTSVNASLLDMVRRTKDCIRSLPRNGWSYFTSRFADESNARTFASEFPVEIVFNYTGLYQQLERSDALFEEVRLPDGCHPASSLEVRRFSLFDVGMHVDRGRIVASVIYNKDMHHQPKILQWIDKYEATLIQMAKELPGTSPDWTIIDFPLAFRSYDDIHEFQDIWLGRLGIQFDDVEDIFPCTPMQEGILVAQSKDSRNYRTWFAVEIRVCGDEAQLDLVRLQQAWRAVVNRHTLLRALLIDKFPGSSRVMHVILRDPVPSITCLGSKDEAVIKRLRERQWSSVREIWFTAPCHNLSA